jgi:hypothetical protein
MMSKPTPKPRNLSTRLVRKPTKTRPKKRVVRPGRLRVRRGDRVNFRATGTALTIWIPNSKELFGIGKRLVFDVKKGARSKSFKVAQTAKVGKEYPYAVYCKSDNEFAEARSVPIMIIDPPPKGP